MNRGKRPPSSVAVLLHVGKGLEGAVPTLYADASSENVNHEVDQLLEAGLLRRVLAQVDVGFSNSMIEDRLLHRAHVVAMEGNSFRNPPATRRAS